MSTSYEERFCLFLDILGFEGLVRRTENNKLVAEQLLPPLIKTINALRSIGPTIEREQRAPNSRSTGKAIADLDFRATQFSDSLVVSFLDVEKPEPGYWHSPKHTILIRVHRILRDAINDGMLFRGGFAFGELYHSDTVMLGPALIRAYRLEQSAIYPRVMTDKLTVERLNLRYPEQESDYLWRMFQMNHSDLVYWEYLSLEKVSMSDRALYDLALRKWMRQLSCIIDAGLKESSADVRAKYDWLASRFHITANKLAREGKNIRADEALPEYERRPGSWAELCERYAPFPEGFFRPPRA